MKTCIYTISLNEEKHVERFYNASKEADYVFVLDTGSTDNTTKLFKECGINFQIVKIKPWRFDIARNIALSLIPKDIDVCFSIDLDEYPLEGWTDEIKKNWSNDVTRATYEYTWSFKENGEPDVVFMTDKLHSRNGYIWKHPVHETLYYNGLQSEKIINLSNIKLHHKADVNKPRSQYLPLLEIATKEEPTNDRMSYYYGRELFFYGFYEKSIQELNRHINLPTATWNAERSSSMQFIAKSYLKLGNSYEAKKWFIKSILECEIRENWFELVEYFYNINDWEGCLWAIKNCLKYENKTTTYLYSTNAWNETIYIYATLASYYSGNVELSKKYSDIAFSINPNNPYCIKNNEFFKGNI